MKLNRKISLIILIFFSIPFLNFSAPFFGGFYYTDNYFESSKFTTDNKFSFYLEDQFNDNFKLYSRFTFNFNYYANYVSVSNILVNSSINNFSLIPNIDLLFLEFKANKDENTADNNKGFINYNFFLFRIGRVQVDQGSSFVFSYKGDGLNTYFTYKNFRFNLFAISNSLDYSPMFDFMNGECLPVFTKWDLKRYPLLSNYNIPGNNYGFISDTTTSDYNFYFNQSNNNNYATNDYSSSEKARLNKLRFISCLAGRIFTGFGFELMQLYFQNLSVNFLANIDLIPEDFVVTYPSRTNDVYNTFGGRYTSFYINFSANGKIYGGLFYDFDAVYETGYNATYQDDSVSISYTNALINSFALYHRISYYFSNIAKPAIHLSFMYAHGDEDMEFRDNTVVNLQGQDNNYRSPTSYPVGFVIDPYFSNLCIIELSNTVKPFSFVKNPIFSRFMIEDGVLLILRPVIKGASFLSEKSYYLSGNNGYTNPEKAYLGVEMDLAATWQVFSDFAFCIKGGILVPNFDIYNGNTILWRVGATVTFSF